MFGKFMNKKFFHPGSYPNQKQRWVHEQRAAAKDKNEQEKQATYQKEQENYQSRLLSAKSSGDKLKLDLNFMYDLPPGMRKDDIEEENEKEEVKFEWQKHAPRSKYLKDLGLECQDQPFGVCVRNIRCFKCRQWGHQNTDRECPLFFSNTQSEANTSSSQAENLRMSDPLRLVADMKKQHRITLKRSVIGQEIDPMAESHQLVDSEDELTELGDNDLAYIESLTDKQKRKLLKSLNKLEKSKKKRKERKKKKKRKKSESDEYEEICKSPSDESHSRKSRSNTRKRQKYNDDSRQNDSSDNDHATDTFKEIRKCREQAKHKHLEQLASKRSRTYERRGDREKKRSKKL